MARKWKLRRHIGLGAEGGGGFLIHVGSVELSRSTNMTFSHGVHALRGPSIASTRAVAAVTCTPGRIGAGGARVIQRGISSVPELNTLLPFGVQLVIVPSCQSNPTTRHMDAFIEREVMSMIIFPAKKPQSFPIKFNVK